MIKEIATKIQQNYKARTKEESDPGFGTRQVSGRTRVLNKDGTVNIRRITGERLDVVQIYQKLLLMDWKKFLGFVVLSYFLINLLFAALYMVVGMKNFNGTQNASFWNDFQDAFFFSAQTLTTVGYGHISPESFGASSIAAIESMMGLLGFAIATGLIYGKFSRPQGRMKFSSKAIVAPYRGITALMLRVGNKNMSELIEAEVEVMLAMNDPETGRRAFHNLSLELRRINFLALTWTIVHPIDEQSPLLGLSREDLENRNAEVMVILKAFDDTFSQQVYSRTSYKAEEIAYGEKFVPILPETGSGGFIQLDLKKVGQTEKAELPF